MQLRPSRRHLRQIQQGAHTKPGPPPRADIARLSPTILTVTIVLVLVVIAVLVCALTVIVTVYMKKNKRSRFDNETSQLSIGQTYRTRVTQHLSTDEPRYVENIHTVL